MESKSKFPIRNPSGSWKLNPSLRNQTRGDGLLDADAGSMPAGTLNEALCLLGTYSQREETGPWVLTT